MLEIVVQIRAIAQKYHSQYENSVGHTVLAIELMQSLDLISEGVSQPNFKTLYFKPEIQQAYCLALLFNIDKRQAAGKYHFHNIQQCYLSEKHYFLRGCDMDNIKNSGKLSPIEAIERKNHYLACCENELKKNLAEQCALEVCQLEIFQDFLKLKNNVLLQQYLDIYIKIETAPYHCLKAGYLITPPLIPAPAKAVITPSWADIAKRKRVNCLPPLANIDLNAQKKIKRETLPIHKMI